MSAEPNDVRQVGPYQVIETLGEGAFGELLLARAPDGRQVVVKLLKIDRLIDDKALELFRREAGVLRSLDHPAVPCFVDSGVAQDGIPYLVQEHIPGETLQQAVDGGRRFDSDGAIALAHRLLDALDYLHELHPPVIHRDIKPANIILAEPLGDPGDPDGGSDRDPAPVIVDFGAVCGGAMFADETSDTVVGTFGYMAPEMLKGKVSPAADLYSLGATLLFAFSGREPERFPEKRLKIRFRDTIHLPPRLADLLEALLEPAVEDRPPDVATARAILGPRGAAVEGDGGAASGCEAAPSALSRGALVKTPPTPMKPTSLRRQILKYGGIAAGVGILAVLIRVGPAAFIKLIETFAITGAIIVAVVLVILTLVGGC
jgi:serine/threonine protein kinase